MNVMKFDFLIVSTLILTFSWLFLATQADAAINQVITNFDSITVAINN